ncbi:MAG: type II toxin-antitoxin system HicA family toxin [Dehalococcoidia bacterium]|nr:type II toxin-antitoxin system HicA family toxin [Dehalococcoidia bacterium]
MPNVRRLSGEEVIGILERFDFAIYSQRGSHIKLRRVTHTGQRQSLTVPRHRELDIGTLQAIFRQASRFVPGDDLWPYFYTN